MSSNPSEEKTPQPGSLQAMLARLRGMVQALKSSEPGQAPPPEFMPTWDGPTAAPGQTMPGSEAGPPLDETPRQASAAETPAPAVEPASTSEQASSAARNADIPVAEELPVPPPTLQLCPYCHARRKNEHVYCDECGWIFPTVEATPAAAPTVPQNRIKDRFLLGDKISERGGVTRFRGLDFGSGRGEPASVVVLRAPRTPSSEAAPAAEPVTQAEPAPVPEQAATESGEGVDLRQTLVWIPALTAAAAAAVARPAWPSIAWEHSLLERAGHTALPRIVDHFSEGDCEYLVEEVPAGQALWDAWDDPQVSAEQRFGWLKQIAGALHRLHQCGAILEGLRPDIVTVSGGEYACLTDLADLLPLPLPPDPPIRATHYTAPELVLSSHQADARSDLYSFGAMLYALHMGRELTELDFELQGVPKSIYDRFPAIHPLFGRLVSKTFCRDLAKRFPTEEAAKEDATGFAELIRTLETCRRTLDHVRLDIAAWTTTGMVRTGNEDAFALLHATESSENTLGDSALVLLADGMGGYEAGEVAAALAIQAMRKYLLQQKPFAAVAGEATPLPDEKHLAEFIPPPDRATYKQLLAAALKEANKAVYMAAHGVEARRGMGCTAEAVYVHARDLIVGHVGDSRTYHLQAGKLVQLTRDQTWVNRMVEMGAMTAEEAELHPRRSELHQAIGGYPDVEPALYEATLKPGDWVVVCSDGLSNHIDDGTLIEILLNGKAAEAVARRLVNLANHEEATDNATVVVIRAT